MTNWPEDMTFAQALAHPDFSHVSIREWFGSMYCAYGRADSPSGVELMATGRGEEAKAALDAHNLRAHYGPSRGDLALTGSPR